MTYRLFEGKDHAFIYHKYRIPPPEEVKNRILQYLDKKKGQPHVLAVDLGCGTGQLSRVLAPHFQEVVGLDVSESQLEQARAVPGHPNISYRRLNTGKGAQTLAAACSSHHPSSCVTVTCLCRNFLPLFLQEQHQSRLEGPAEELPFPDGSVDLLAASSAAHWFDQARFLGQASRVLKAGGCITLVDYALASSRLEYQDCGDTDTHIFKEAKEALSPHTSSPVAQSQSKLEDLFAAISFSDKERIDSIHVNTSLSVRDLTGLIETWSMFQTFVKKHPREAGHMLIHTQNRFLEEMGVVSPDTEICFEMEYYCVLASKPASLD